ncbi:DUF3467 domain-containing protein [Candidatus Woesearchaeota archaeon]|nr:DUF3467 domain-containing protein [Candidatus Woesearchaeota archaeon]
MTEKKSINIGINDGNEFFAHETSVHFNPTQFIIDFRNITPRLDPRAKETPFMVLKHNLILIDPWHAKEVLRILTNTIERYEKQFGRIDQPKAVKKYLKEAKKLKDKKVPKSQTPSYMG